MIYFQLIFFPTKKLSFRRRISAAWEFFIDGRPLWIRVLLRNRKLTWHGKVRVFLHALRNGWHLTKRREQADAR
jgi:hypothetical protein